MTDSGGRFSLDGLDPKAYRLVVRKPAYQTETRDVTPSEDAEVRVELRRGEGIGLVARDGIFGTPLRGVFVRVVDGVGTSVFSGSVSLDSEGRGEIPSLRPGHTRCGRGAGLRPVTLRRDSCRAPARAPSPRAVPSRSRWARRPPPGPTPALACSRPTARLHRVDLLDRRSHPSGGQPVRRLENVAPGRYTLSVEGGVTRPVDVREGGAATIALP